jgi:hypothetical protein
MAATLVRTLLGRRFFPIPLPARGSGPSGSAVVHRDRRVLRVKPERQDRRVSREFRVRSVRLVRLVLRESPDPQVPKVCKVLMVFRDPLVLKVE